MPGGPFPARIKGGITTTVPTAPSFISGTTATFTVGSTDFFVAQATGDLPITITKTSGTFPAGLFGADYGGGFYVIGGKPTASGSANITLHATNGAGSANQTISVTVPAVTGSTVYLSPNSIDNTGATDVTAALQAWIDSVPNGATLTPNIMRLRAGTYRVESIVWLRFRKNFVLDFSLGAQVIANTDAAGLTLPGTFDQRQRSQFIFTCCQNFVVYEPNVRGANPVTDYTNRAIYVDVLELQHALRFAGCLDYEVSGGTLSRTYGDGIYNGYGQPSAGVHQLCQRGWIHDTEIFQTGRQGISPCGVRDHVFEDGYNHHNGRASFDFEPIGFPAKVGGSDPDTFGVFNTHLSGWTFGPCYLSTIAHKGSGFTDTFVIKNCTGLTQNDCEFKGFFGASDFNDHTPGEQRYNLWIVNNSFPGNGSQFASSGGHGAIQMQRYSRVYVGGNNIPVQNRKYLQDTVKQGTTTVKDPLWTGGREPFVQASYCTDVTVTGNTVNGAPQLAYAWQYTDTPFTPSATPPAEPICGAQFARRSTGGWHP